MIKNRKKLENLEKDHFNQQTVCEALGGVDNYGLQSIEKLIEWGFEVFNWATEKPFHSLQNQMNMICKKHMFSKNIKKVV